MNNGSKPAAKSTTLWAAVFFVVCGLAVGAQGSPWVQTHPEVAYWVPIVGGILVGLWRFIFGEPLTIGTKTVTRKK